MKLQSTFLLLLLLLHHHLLPLIYTDAVGVCWGTNSSQPLPPSMVVRNLLQTNHIGHVRLFDADPLAMQSLAGTGIRVSVGIPNEMLRGLNSSVKVARRWVHDNITRYLDAASADGAVKIEYISVGEEPFRVSYGQQFHPFVVGAASNIHLALTEAKFSKRVKLTVPCSSDVYGGYNSSSLPSTGDFRSDLNKTMTQLLEFLHKHKFPFTIDINPFLELQQNQNFTMEHALFEPTSHHHRPITDGRNKYSNILDSSIDKLVTCLTKAGFGNLDILVGRIGWPTDGSTNATTAIAQAFMEGLMNHLRSKVGTPLRPKKPPVETYISSLLDEDRLSIANGQSYNRHWGVFTFDGQAKYNIDLGQDSSKKTSTVSARNVDYLNLRWCVLDNNKDTSNASAVFSEACSQADCSVLAAGGSCSTIGWPGNVSYALNSYYQQHSQNQDCCVFGGLGLITVVDPSSGECRFPVGLRTSIASPDSPLACLFTLLIIIMLI